MERMKAGILKVNESRWSESNDMRSEDYRFIYCSATNEMTGVGFILNKLIANKVKSVLGI